MSTNSLRASFRSVIDLNAALDVVVADPSRRAALSSIADSAQDLLSAGPVELIRQLPDAVSSAMEEHGWLWNGFYAPGEDGHLHLGPACGPPVCAVLESRGGPLTSGMCFDGMHLNQALVAYDIKQWPGYVSCDGASGLATVAGMVVPVRDPAGAPIAVWDLDATQPLQPGDVRFMDVLFATLGRCVAIDPTCFASASPAS